MKIINSVTILDSSDFEIKLDEKRSVELIAEFVLSEERKLK